MAEAVASYCLYDDTFMTAITGFSFDVDFYYNILNNKIFAP